MVYVRRLVWFILGRLLLICLLGALLVCGFYMCLNTANIYIIVTDGMQKRADVILTREDAAALNFYFHPDFLTRDRALEGAFDGTSAYMDYTITDFEYDLKVESLWAWPWDYTATCTVTERMPEIKGSVISGRSNEVSPNIPQWQGGKYSLTLTKQDGAWKIIGMQQKSVIVEAVNKE